jgi:hypothetical protein
MVRAPRALILKSFAAELLALGNTQPPRQRTAERLAFAR